VHTPSMQMSSVQTLPSKHWELTVQRMTSSALLATEVLIGSAVERLARYCAYRPCKFRDGPSGTKDVHEPSLGSGVSPTRTAVLRVVPAGVAFSARNAPQDAGLPASKSREWNVH
jgi:hypothetical protein